MRPTRDHLRLYTVPTAIVNILAGTFPAPAICQPREGYFYNFDFETVLPVSKTTADRNFPVLLRFVLCPSRSSDF